MKSHHSDGAPAAIGPYSQAVSAGGFLFTAGQVAIDPASGRIVDGGFAAQAERVMDNLAAVLSAAGCGFEDVVKTTIYLVDFADFAAINEIYGRRLADHRPARSTVQVAALPMGARLEIDMVARLRSSG